MDDFTKTKLINNLIDLVDYFYENKRKSGSASQIKYLKGFCEGIAHTLAEAGALDKEEAKRILKGIGKRRTLPVSAKKAIKTQTAAVAQTAKEPTATPQATAESLDIPTIFRKEAAKRGDTEV